MKNPNTLVRSQLSLYQIYFQLTPKPNLSFELSFHILSFEDKLLCQFARQLTNDPGYAGKDSQINILRQNGFDDRSILDATLVIAYFNFVNRIVLALDVQPEADAGEGFKY